MWRASCFLLEVYHVWVNYGKQLGDFASVFLQDSQRDMKPQSFRVMSVLRSPELLSKLRKLCQ